MNFIGALLSQFLAILAYTLLLAIVYKLVRIENELGAIKKLLQGQPSPTEATASAPIERVAHSVDLHENDDATEYAARLLRAVNAESKAPTVPNYPVRSE